MGTPGAKAKSGSSIVGPQKSGCFSGGANRNGSIEKFYPSQSQDMILSGKGPSKTDPEKTEAENKAANESRIRSKADDVGNFRYERSVQKGGAKDPNEGMIYGKAGQESTRLRGAVGDLDKINSNLSARSQSEIINKASKISGVSGMDYVSKSSGSYDHMKQRASLKSYGKSGGGFMSSKEMQSVGDGGKTHQQNLNAEKSQFKKSNQFHDALKTGASQYTSEGKHKTMKQQTGLKSSSGTFGIGGANKIHSSKGYGINKILGDLDKSGDLSAYEAKRQAAIDKNMSKGSTKKGYKH